MSSGLSDRLSVRGGGDSENLVLFDGFYVVRPFHNMFGDSIFLSDLVGDMTLYKGVLPLQHGQALSSVLDIDPAEAMPPFHGRLDIGALNASLSLNGSLLDGKLNWSAGLRRMNYDFIQLINSIYTGNFHPSGDTNFSYYDFQGIISYEVPENKFDFIWLYSYEPMSIFYSNTYLSETSDGYYSLGFRWDHSFSGFLNLDQRIQWSSYSRSFSIDDKETPINYVDVNKIDVISYKNLLSMNFSDKLGCRTGFDIFYYPRAFYSNSIENSSTTNIDEGTIKIVSGSVESKTNLGIYSMFAETEMSPLKSMSILAGGRITYCDFLNKANVDPRLTGKYDFNFLTLSASIGKMTEFFTDPFLLYSYSNQIKQIDLSECWMSDLGGRIKFFESYSLDSDVYCKYYDNVPVKGEDDLYHTGISFARVYGFDIMLKKQPDNFPFYGWLSFSSFKREIFRTEGINENSSFTGGFFDTGRSHYGFSDADLINYHFYGTIPVKQWYEGNSMDYKINLTVIYEINKKFVVTGEFNLVSGDYYTPVIGGEPHTAVNQQGVTNIVYTPIYGTFHSTKLPDKHKLSFKLEWNNETVNGIPYGFYYQLDNIYNYQAVIRYDYNFDFTKKTEVKELLGFTPIVGFWMKW